MGCILEAASWVAGESRTDRPASVTPVVAAFLRSWNDGLSDDDRNDLPSVRWVCVGFEIVCRHRDGSGIHGLRLAGATRTAVWLAQVPALGAHAAVSAACRCSTPPQLERRRSMRLSPSQGRQPRRLTSPSKGPRKERSESNPSRGPVGGPFRRSSYGRWAVLGFQRACWCRGQGGCL